MGIEFDEAKRMQTLAARGLDFADAGFLFAGVHAQMPAMTMASRASKRWVSSTAMPPWWYGRHAVKRAELSA